MTGGIDDGSGSDASGEQAKSIPDDSSSRADKDVRNQRGRDKFSGMSILQKAKATDAANKRWLGAIATSAHLRPS
jgi:hypothetical protein